MPSIFTSTLWEHKWLAHNTFLSCTFVLRKRVNQKALSSIKFLQRRENQNAFTKVSTKIKRVQLMKQRMRNFQLQMIQSSLSQDILTYSSVVKTFWTRLMPHVNNHACQPQRISTIRKCVIAYLITMNSTKSHYPTQIFD